MAKNLALTVSSPFLGTRLVPCENIASIFFTSTTVITIKYVSGTSTAITLTAADTTWGQHNLILNAIMEAQGRGTDPSWNITVPGIAAITTIT